MRWVLRVTSDRPDFDPLEIRADPGQRQRDADIQVGRKSPRRLPSRPLEDPQRLGQSASRICFRRDARPASPWSGFRRHQPD